MCLFLLHVGATIITERKENVIGKIPVRVFPARALAVTDLPFDINSPRRPAIQTLCNPLFPRGKKRSPLLRTRPGQAVVPRHIRPAFVLLSGLIDSRHSFDTSLADSASGHFLSNNKL